MANVAVVQLRRMETTQPWGFRLKGGVDQGLPLHVEHVSTRLLSPSSKRKHRLSAVLDDDAKGIETWKRDKALARCGMKLPNL